MATTYTLTGASDWGMFVFMLGGIAALLTFACALVGLMWADLRTRLRDIIADQARSCKTAHATISKEFDAVWAAIDECCPRGERKRKYEND